MLDSEYNAFLIGAITAIIGAIIGAIIVAAWDYYKIHKETINKETQILNAFKEEIATNLSIILDNKELVNQDIKILKDKKTILEPLVTLHSAALSLIKLNFPNHLLDFNTISDIIEISIWIDRINENIRSRENFRISNAIASNVSTRIEKYDDLLIKLLDRNEAQLISLNEKLETPKIIVKADEAGAYYEIKERL